MKSADGPLHTWPFLGAPSLMWNEETQSKDLNSDLATYQRRDLEPVICLHSWGQ